MGFLAGEATQGECNQETSSPIVRIYVHPHRNTDGDIDRSGWAHNLLTWWGNYTNNYKRYLLEKTCRENITATKALKSTAEKYGMSLKAKSHGYARQDKTQNCLVCVASTSAVWSDVNFSWQSKLCLFITKTRYLVTSLWRKSGVASKIQLVNTVVASNQSC